MISKRLIKTLAAAPLLCSAALSLAQQFPTKPITIVVPFVTGGQMDLSARIVSEPMSKILGQPVIVENRSGASGNIAYRLMARAPKDGYSLLVGYSGTHACNPALFSNLGWEPKDFVPIGMLTISSHVIVVHPSVPANNLRELIAYAKQNPGKINYASGGIGALSHIGPMRIQQLTQTEMVHVPYKGAGEVVSDLIGGRVQMFVTTPPSVMQHVNAGRLRAIAVTGMTRMPSMPDVPTANESGLPGFELEAWASLFAPAGTPPDVIARLSDAVRRSVDLPESRQRAAGAGLEIRLVGPDAMAAQVKKDIDICSTAVRTAGIKAE
jgi:tripartite-type tricarboxylate transporter receptor subunit TctC